MDNNYSLKEILVVIIGIIFALPILFTILLPLLLIGVSISVCLLLLAFFPAILTVIYNNFKFIIPILVGLLLLWLMLV